MTLSVVVGLFGLYAVLDGAWAVTAGVRASSGRIRDAWPVVLEGAISVGLGALALGWPLIAGQFVHVLAAWGLGTGVLEIIAALSLRNRGAGFWLLVTGGLSSLFLATLILLLPHADVAMVVRLIASYALVFGLTMLVAAVRFLPDRAARRYVESRG